LIFGKRLINEAALAMKVSGGIYCPAQHELKV